MKRKEQEQEISVEETQLYDRQIRLWGLEAQTRIRTCSLLMIGCTGLTNEVLKNLVLAGVGSILLVDDGLVTVQDLGCQFFLRKEDVGKPRASCVVSRCLLNPNVSLKSASTYNIMDYDIVLCFGKSHQEQLKLNKLCRDHNVPFISAHCFGYRGFLFLDLIQHEYLKKESLTLSSYSPLDQLYKKDFQGVKVKKQHPLYFALGLYWTCVNPLKDKSDFLAKRHTNIQLSDDYLTSVIKQMSHEVPAACAILGGFLSQECIKVVSKKDEPFNNFFCFDAWTSSGFIMNL